MTAADLLLLALFLLFALISWLGAAIGRARARHEAFAEAPRGGREPRGAPPVARPPPAAPPLPARPPASPADGSAPRAAELTRALRDRGSLRRAVVLAAILDRPSDRDVPLA
ncbi:hypothetical protein WMF31_21655 [Sorangium sp. So ce1036]|uniref:hypothetical protein n=1 Tax=Sorangium sp. So ce1036 TaxID=3133328 RepID=UPI003F09A779